MIEKEANYYERQLGLSPGTCITLFVNEDGKLDWRVLTKEEELELNLHPAKSCRCESCGREKDDVEYRHYSNSVGDNRLDKKFLCGSCFLSKAIEISWEDA